MAESSLTLLSAALLLFLVMDPLGNIPMFITALKNVLGALTLAWLASSLILLFASGMRRHLGAKGLIALERLMGMVLVTLAVQMLMSGIRLFLASLPPSS
jgi:small neutral amino acid transporter SnatA (MarC family)